MVSKVALPDSPVTAVTFGDDLWTDEDGATEHGSVTITFANGQKLVGRAEGDCCAYAFIKDSDGMLGLVGKVLDKVESGYDDSGNNRETVEEEYEYIDTFTEVLSTTDGHDAILNCAVSHNGYYGGWIEWRVEEQQ